MSESHAAKQTTPFQASDGALNDACFAYVPDSAKPSTRKLKLCGPDGKKDAKIVGAAKAALGKGYRGNRVQIPSGARSSVVAKVNAAAKSVGLDPISASEIDPAAFDEPSASDAHVDVPIGALNRMRSRLKGKLRHGRALTSDDIDEAHKHAKRTALLPTDNTGATAQMSEAVQMCDGGDVWPKLAKADPNVNYRMASADNPTDDGDGDIDACGSCRFFQWGRCQLVEGTIEADHVCSLFKDQPVTFISDDDLAELNDDGDEMAAMGYVEPPLRFAESLKFPNLPATDLMQFLPQIKPFSEPPEWLNYLPGPGTYTHASYGKVPMPADRIANFVTQFNAGVYQKNLPIDAEHQTKLSGATGYIKEMRVASDGSAEARIEWTDRGKKLLASDRFKYFSPEWFDQWTDPVDEKVYRDIAIGGALTTRPFFKERALKPLAASEMGAVEWIDESEAVTTTANETPSTRQGAKTMAEDQNTTPVAMTEEQIEKRFAEIEASHKSELEALKTASEAQATKLAAEVETERTARQAAEQDARTKRFTDEVRGRSDSNGAPWIGDVQAKVATLDHLAKTAGEDSDVFKNYVADQRAVAAQVKDSALFKVFGGDFPAADASANPYEALMAQARTYAEAHPEFTPERAFSEIVINDAKNKDLVAKL